MQLRQPCYLYWFLSIGDSVPDGTDPKQGTDSEPPRKSKLEQETHTDEVVSNCSDYPFRQAVQVIIISAFVQNWVLKYGPLFSVSICAH